MAKMVAYKSQNIVKNCPFFYIWGIDVLFLSGQGKGKLLCIVRHVATDNALNVLAFRERQAHFGEVGRWFIHPLVHHLHPDVGLADILRSPFQRIIPNGLTVYVPSYALSMI